MGNVNYSLSILINDLRADLAFYAKTCLKLEKVSFWSGIVIVLRFPTLWLLACHRYGFWVNSRFRNKFIRLFMGFFYILGKRILEIKTKSVILKTAEIGPGFCLAGKRGMFIGAKKIGRECIVFENVTMGKDILGGCPELGNFVSVGPETVIYGDIKIGEGVLIKASTIITKSVPSYSIVQGNPGRIVKRIRP
jgi:serine O-acetyltransferase